MIAFVVYGSHVEHTNFLLNEDNIQSQAAVMTERAAEDKETRNDRLEKFHRAYTIMVITYFYLFFAVDFVALRAPSCASNIIYTIFSKYYLLKTRNYESYEYKTT